MGLVRAVSQGISRVNTQSESSVAIATNGLGISNAALLAVGKNNTIDRQNGQKIMRGVQAIQRPLTQEKARTLGAEIGAVIRDAHTMQMLEKPLIAATKGYVAAAKSRANIAIAAGEAGQAVAQINAEAQHKLSEGHAKASFNTAISQAASRFAI